VRLSTAEDFIKSGELLPAHDNHTICCARGALRMLLWVTWCLSSLWYGWNLSIVIPARVQGVETEFGIRYGKGVYDYDLTSRVDSGAMDIKLIIIS